VRTPVVVFFSLAGDFAARIEQGPEPTDIQALLPQTPIETFHMHILRRLAWLDMHDVDPPLRVVAGGEDPKQPSVDQELPPINVRRPPIHTAPIQVNVDMVLLNVTVTDDYERVVTGLDSSNFLVFDDKVEREIVSFSTEDTPTSVGLIFDSSGSMSDKIQKIQGSCGTILQNLESPGRVSAD